MRAISWRLDSPFLLIVFFAFAFIEDSPISYSALLVLLPYLQVQLKPLNIETKEVED